MKVVGDGKLVVDDKERVGRFTTETIKAGGLIEVSRESKAAKEDDDVEESSSTSTKGTGKRRR